ncbi:acyltransferase family protein [Aeromonas rivipollensis]|uniref:acyltransferase family protein n=1 Tax=Aeromonas rivipollensis TaxID=948519 RepID=UPI0038D1F362
MRVNNKTIDSIQALRGIAAFLVIFFHFQFYFNFDGYDIGTFLFNNGRIGVPIFFVISGFIMAYTTTRVGIKESPKFIIKRILRIVPLYVIATLTYILILNFTLPNTADLNDLTDISKSLLFYPLQNYDAPYFGWSTLAVGWTLNYEMFFYLAFAISIAFGRYCWAAMAIGFISLLIVFPLISTGAWSYLPEVNYGFEYAYASLMSNPIMWNFVAGIACGIIIKNNIIKISKITSATLVVVISLLYLAQYAKNINPGWGFTEWGFGAAALILFLVNHEHNYGLKIPFILKYFGEISFSLYLNHLIVKEFIFMLGLKFNIEIFKAGPVCGVIIIAITIALSAWTRKYIEIELSNFIKRKLSSMITRNPQSRHTDVMHTLVRTKDHGQVQGTAPTKPRL